MNTKQSGYIFVVFISFVLSMDPAMGRIFGGGRFMQSGGGCSGGSCGGSVRVSPGGSCRGGSCGPRSQGSQGGCSGGSCRTGNIPRPVTPSINASVPEPQVEWVAPTLSLIQGNLYTRTNRGPAPNDSVYYWRDPNGVDREIRVWNRPGEYQGLLVDSNRDIANPLPNQAAEELLSLYLQTRSCDSRADLVQAICNQYPDIAATIAAEKAASAGVNRLASEQSVQPFSAQLGSTGPDVESSEGNSALKGFEGLTQIQPTPGAFAAGPGESSSAVTGSTVPESHVGSARGASIPKSNTGPVESPVVSESRPIAPKRESAVVAEPVTGREPMRTWDDFNKIMKRTDENTKVLITFGADWCPGCVSLKGHQARIKSEYERANPGKNLVWYNLNVDSRPAIYGSARNGGKIPHTWVYEGGSFGVPGQAFTGDRTNWRSVPLLGN